MQLSARVTVIGGGLAGIVAAVAASRAGAQVTLVSRAPGATALCPGGVDLVSSPPRRGAGRPWPAADGRHLPGLGPAGTRPTLAQNLAHLQSVQPEHPLAVLGIEPAELVGVAQFLREHLLGAPLAWKGLEQPPFLLPTEAGTLREMDLPPAAAEGGDLSEARLDDGMRVGVVGLPELPSFDPSFLAGALGERVGSAGRFVPLLPTVVYGDGRPLHPVAIARVIEEEQGEYLVGTLAGMVRGLGLTHLLLPPVVGLSGSPGLLARLRDVTGLVPFEALAVTSPCPGLRLLDALHDMADAYGVQRLHGAVLSYELDEATLRVTGLLVGLQHGGTFRLPCSEVVLATGGLWGGGIEWAQAACEPIFGLPVVSGPHPAAHAQPCQRPLPLSLLPDPRVPQASFAAGVRTDGQLRPLDPGKNHWPIVNLRACGGVLHGHDPGARRGGTGVALLTGWRAGLLAAGAEVQR